MTSCWFEWQVNPRKRHLPWVLSFIESGLDPFVGQVGRILDAVDAQDLDVVRVETAEARFGRGDDAGLGEGSSEMEPCMDVELVPSEGFEGPADQPFDVSVFVALGGVEVVDAALDEPEEEPLVRKRAPAEAYLGDEKAGPSQAAVNHAVF